uniref:Uncharacterized protein LOC114345694 n=1 Tax=Diabrotica virgifera virgifera TaxID=50390 RepID=A0A6P7H3L9_DIAVI
MVLKFGDWQDLRKLGGKKVFWEDKLEQVIEAVRVGIRERALERATGSNFCNHYRELMGLGVDMGYMRDEEILDQYLQPKKTEKKKPWMTDGILQMMDRRRESKRKDYVTYQFLEKEIKKAAREAKNRNLEEQSVGRERQEDPVPGSVWVREQPRLVQGANPEAELASGQSADKKASSKLGPFVPTHDVSSWISVTPPPRSNLFQKLPEESDGYSTVDDQRSQKDGDFQIPRKSSKKKKSNNREEKSEKSEDKPQSEAEDMEEYEVDAAGRGTTKRARTAKSESEGEKSAKEELAVMRELLKKMSAQFDDQMAKNEEEVTRQRAEIERQNAVMAQQREEMMKMSNRMDDLLKELKETRKLLEKSHQQE